jgi:hypothetical protein
MGNLEILPGSQEPQRSKAVAVLPPLAQVCQSPQDYLAKLDVAALNLMCAGGLPHADNIDIPKLLEWRYCRWTGNCRRKRSVRNRIWLQLLETWGTG